MKRDSKPNEPIVSNLSSLSLVQHLVNDTCKGQESRTFVVNSSSLHYLALRDTALPLGTILQRLSLCYTSKHRYLCYASYSMQGNAVLRFAIFHIWLAIILCNVSNIKICPQRHPRTKPNTPIGRLPRPSAISTTPSLPKRGAQYHTRDALPATQRHAHCATHDDVILDLEGPEEHHSLFRDMWRH